MVISLCVLTRRHSRDRRQDSAARAARRAGMQYVRGIDHQDVRPYARSSHVLLSSSIADPPNSFGPFNKSAFVVLAARWCRPCLTLR